METKLGRGLSAILGDEPGETPNNDLTKIGSDLIVTNENQPRHYFDPEKLKELADSIALHGILQPLTVRQKGNNYELLAGERRLRAAKMAGLKEVPVYIIQCSDEDVLTFALIENLQRDDLTPLEEAEAFKSLIDEHHCTQESLAFMVCKSRTYITNSMRLLALPDSVKKLVNEGLLSSGHAKLLVGVHDAEKYASMVLRNKMSVRALEGLMQKVKKGLIQSGTTTKFEKYKNPDEEDIALRISNVLGLKTTLKITDKGGMLTIHCSSCEQLESLTQTLLSIGDNTSPDNPVKPSVEWI